MRSYRPAFLGYPDARPYVMAARGPLYWNQYKPVGYPLMLRALRKLDGRLSTTIAVQHALGLGTAALAHRAASPQLRRPSLALFPAAVVAFGGSQVWLEHSVLSDSPYTFLLTAIMYGAERSTRTSTRRRRRAWLAGTGTALGASVTLRTAGVLLVPVLGGWVGLGGSGQPHGSGRRHRLEAGAGDAAALLAPCALLLGAYLLPQARRTGRWGLTRSGSFAFYGRMAPLADPRRFNPPRGTEELVEDSDPRERPNLNWYVFDRDSPAIRAYGDPPYPLDGAPPGMAYRWSGEEPTRRFARAVLRQQPLDYLASVAEGLANYVRPRTGRRSVFEYDQPQLIRNLHDPHFEKLAMDDVAAFYTTPPGYARVGVERLEAFGIKLRTEGWPTAILTALALAGLQHPRGPATTSGRSPQATWLFVLSALTLAAGPVASLFYDVRYAAPMVVPLAAAAAIGLDRLLPGTST
jgi:hypothetical protein